LFVLLASFLWLVDVRLDLEVLGCWIYKCMTFCWPRRDIWYNNIIYVVIVSRPHSDRSGTTVSERPSATRPTRTFSSSCHTVSTSRLSTLVHRLPLNRWRKIPVNRITLLPASTASRLSFYLLTLFLRTLGNGQRRSTLSRSRTALVRSLHP
jgi:hypothetical protein